MNPSVAQPAAVLSPHSRRRSVLILFAIALLALIAAAAYFAAARHRLAQANAAVAAERQASADLRVREQEAQLRDQLAATAAKLVEDASAQGFDPARWGERRINIRQAHLSRDAVNELLLTTARGEGRLFGAEAFEISVTRLNDGLFDPPDAETQPLLLSLRGTQLFTTQDGHL